MSIELRPLIRPLIPTPLSRPTAFTPQRRFAAGAGAAPPLRLAGPKVGEYNERRAIGVRRSGTPRRKRMASVKRRYSKEEFARRGDAIYEKAVRPQLKASDQGKFAAIDIDSGEFAISADELKACHK